MSLESKISNLNTKLAAGALISGLALGTDAKATNYPINPGMSVEEASQILSSLGPGDRAYLTGNYTLPQDRERWLRMNNVQGLAMRLAEFDLNGYQIIGQDTTSGLAIELTGLCENVVIRNGYIKGTLAGIKIGGDFDDILIDNIFVTGVGDKPIIFNHVYDANPTGQASIWIQNSYFQFSDQFNSGIGIHFNKGQSPVTDNTKYVGGNNITVEYVGGTGIDAPVIWENGRIFKTKGKDEFSEILVINSAEFFPPDAIEGFRREGLGPQGGPSYNVEYNKVDPEYQSLVDLGVGEGNIDIPANDNPRLVYVRDRWGNKWLAPFHGSPAIGEQFNNGYAGAIPPVGIFLTARDSK